MCGKLFKEEDTQNNTEDKNNSFQGKNLIYSLTCCDCDVAQESGVLPS